MRISAIFILLLALVSVWVYAYQQRSPEVNVVNRPTPEYLFKVVSQDDWDASKESDTIHLPAADTDFIHLSTEEQLVRIIDKYWKGVPTYIVLKVNTRVLPGRLLLETNPGGTDRYYHLYRGAIPKAAIIEVAVRRSQIDQQH